MFQRTLMAIAAVGLLTTGATGPAFSRTAAPNFAGTWTLTKSTTQFRPGHGQLGKPKYQDIKPTTGMSRAGNGGNATGRRLTGRPLFGDGANGASASGGKDHKNWVTIETMNKGSTKSGGGRRADEAPSFGWHYSNLKVRVTR